MDILNHLTCDIRDLRRLADQHGITCSIGATGRLVIRPYRGPRPDVHAACVARHGELLDMLIANRPSPYDLPYETRCNKAADDAAMRVYRMPYEALCNLAIYSLNRWLARADAGLLAYEPPEPPHWDDGLVHNDDVKSVSPTMIPVPRIAGRYSLRGGGRRG
jgi:hypothetical protein